MEMPTIRLGMGLQELASAFHEGVGGGCLLITQGALSSRENAAV